MVQRLASSMRPTKNASAASCRHIMVLPWKHKSVLPTSWAISQTSHEKGSFWIRSSHALLEPLDLLKSNCARLVLPGLLHFPSLKEFLLGGFATHSRAELPPSWLLPWNRWSSLCSHLDQLLGWQWWWWPTHILQLARFLCPPLSLFHRPLHLPCGWGLFDWGGVVHRRGGPHLLFHLLLSHLLGYLGPFCFGT